MRNLQPAALSCIEVSRICSPDRLFEGFPERDSILFRDFERAGVRVHDRRLVRAKVLVRQSEGMTSFISELDGTSMMSTPDRKFAAWDESPTSEDRNRGRFFPTWQCSRRLLLARRLAKALGRGTRPGLSSIIGRAHSNSLPALPAARAVWARAATEHHTFEWAEAGLETAVSAPRQDSRPRVCIPVKNSAIRRSW